MTVDYNDILLESGLIVDGRDTLPRHASKSWDDRDPRLLEGVCYHQSLEAFGTASGNAKYHVSPNHISDGGLPGLSYTLFVEKSGDVILANDIECRTYSQGYKGGIDENEKYIGVCFGGDFSGPGYEGSQLPTPEQLVTAEELWLYLKDKLGFDAGGLYGHFNFGKPACPGYAITEVIDRIIPVVALEDTVEDTVESRQRRLKDLNFYAGTVDGVWGLESKDALIRFQKENGLNPDGVWGPRTEARVRST